MGFRDGRGEEGRYPIVPGTFAKRNIDGGWEATPLGDLYSVLDGAIARLETTLDAITDKPPDVESAVRRLRQIRFELQFIVTEAIESLSIGWRDGVEVFSSGLADRRRWSLAGQVV